MPKKTKSRKVIKKVTRRRRKTPPQIKNGIIVDIDQIYKIINRIQLTKEPSDFITSEMDTFVAENLLRDAGLTFVKSPTKVDGFPNCKHYKVDPPPPARVSKDAFDEFEEFPDEIIEDGQVFF